MDNSTITPAIISLIYEHTLTPSLSQGLTPTRDHAGRPCNNEIAQFEESTFSTGVLDLGFIEELIPHLDHASGLAAKQPLADRDQSNPQISPFDLPIPVCLISNKLKLLQVNHHALSVVTDEIQLPERADIALTIAQPIKKEILSAVTLAVDSNISRTINCKTDTGVIRTIFIVPQTTPDIKPNTAKQALVLFLNHESRASEIAMSLTKTHGLSQSEAEVTAYLVQGYAPEEIAKTKNVSINTVRTQIKKVFTKTGTSRQAQLVSLILNGPAVLMTIFDNQT
ncbi:MAG: helix-turn-helix transcriptional regulator, partial [Proteobacteria bacterium]|nr:helix-turn-helix transcriptional regulator [Pseudomonadota bacterium]